MSIDSKDGIEGLEPDDPQAEQAAPGSAGGTEIDEFGIPVLTDAVTPEQMAETPHLDLVADRLQDHLAEALGRALPGIIEEVAKGAMHRAMPKLESALKKELYRHLGDCIDDIFAAERKKG